MENGNRFGKKRTYTGSKGTTNHDAEKCICNKKNRHSPARWSEVYREQTQTLTQFYYIDK